MSNLERADALSNPEFQKIHELVRNLILGLDQEVISWLELNEVVDDLVERETDLCSPGPRTSDGQTFFYSLEYTFFKRESDELDGELNSVALSVVIYANKGRLIVRQDIASIYAERVYPDLTSDNLTESLLQDLRDDFLQELRVFLEGGPEDAAHELSQIAQNQLKTPLAASPASFQLLHSISFYAHAMWLSRQSADSQTQNTIKSWLSGSEAVWSKNPRCLTQVVRIVDYLGLEDLYPT